jgi:hypothetical protein
MKQRKHREPSKGQAQSRDRFAAHGSEGFSMNQLATNVAMDFIAAPDPVEVHAIGDTTMAPSFMGM